MHEALSQVDLDEQGGLVLRDRIERPPVAARLALRSDPPAPYLPTVYGAKRVRWPAAAGVAAAHVLLFFVALSFDVVELPRLAREPTVVDLISLPSDPPQALPQAEKQTTPELKPPPVVTPPPLVPLPLDSPLPVTTEPPPPRAVVVAPARPVATGPVSAPDLSSTMLVAKPPKYPLESRRKREQGTVVLTVLVGTSGAVAEISIAKSSGFDRLDKAALAAVRAWRWSPAVRDGQPVMVKGFVDIPFVLTG